MLFRKNQICTFCPSSSFANTHKAARIFNRLFHPKGSPFSIPNSPKKEPFLLWQEREAIFIRLQEALPLQKIPFSLSSTTTTFLRPFFFPLPHLVFFFFFSST